jgi:hypothetical protein
MFYVHSYTIPELDIITGALERRLSITALFDLYSAELDSWQGRHYRRSSHPNATGRLQYVPIPSCSAFSKTKMIH